MSESEGNYDDLPKLEEISDGEKVEFVVGERLVTRPAFNAQIKANDTVAGKHILHSMPH